MKCFKNGEWVFVRGRGSIYCIRLGADCWLKLDQEVLIDGLPYKISGIEYFGEPHQKDSDNGTLFKERELVGLLVRRTDY